MGVESWVVGLRTYAGRDSMIRVTAYFSLFIYGLLSLHDESTLTASFFFSSFITFDKLPQWTESFRLISKNFGLCRLIMRFFDDLPAFFSLYIYLKTTSAKTEKEPTKPLNDDTKKKDEDKETKSEKTPVTKKATVHSYVRLLTVINLLFWVAYNPFEHLAWLGELKIINTNEQMWWFYTNVAWAGGLFTSVILNLRTVVLYNTQTVKKASREDDPNYDSSQIVSKSQMQQALLIAFRDFLDWCIAIHFMPEGFLWSAKLYHYQVGLIGTVSSLCRVHTYVINRQ